MTQFPRYLKKFSLEYLFEEQCSLESVVLSSEALLKAIVMDIVWHMVASRLIPNLSVLVASWNILSLEHKLEILQFT